MNESSKHNFDDLRPGPIRNETLPPKLLEQIRTIHRHIGRYIGMNLEEFEIGFMRDLHPEVEVALWTRITLAWHAYHRRHLNSRRESGEHEKKLVGALLAISSGVDDVESLGLPADVGNRLFECYAHPFDD